MEVDRSGLRLKEQSPETGCGEGRTKQTRVRPSLRPKRDEKTACETMRAGGRAGAVFKAKDDAFMRQDCSVCP